jgi:LPS sulfotransferase NodH
MKHSYLLAGITTGKLCRLLGRNGFSLSPKMLARVLFLLQGSVWASVFKRTERRKFKKQLEVYKMPADPVFIIGHWRTGSTYLHQLLALDDKLVTPNVFQVSAVDSFLVSEKYYKPVMTSMMHPTRPMDNVPLGFYEPQEDEYALIKMTPDSPLEKMLFPKNDSYFLNGYKDFYPQNPAAWKKLFYNFCLRLSFIDGKRVLLKNPFHSMRLPLLREMFPEAKFIHIHRHPYAVVPSTIHMWHIVGNENKLKNKSSKYRVDEVSEVLNRLLAYVQRHLKDIPEKNKVEISFEELETDPAGTVKKIYGKLNMTPAPGFEQKLADKIALTKSHRKNKYTLTEQNKEIIKKTLGKHFIYYNYQA